MKKKPKGDVVGIIEIRNAIADYMGSEGCSCCRDSEAHDEAENRIAKLLNVPMYADKSGYDFWKFTTERLKAKEKK